jgi:hypothetical protein
MATGPKKVETRGGSRPGAGRPRIEISDQEVKKLIKAARKKEKETGKGIFDILVSMAYGDDYRVTPKDQISAIRLYVDAVVSKAQQKDVKVTTTQEPAVFLPEQKPDPAKLVPITGGKAGGA